MADEKHDDTVNLVGPTGVRVTAPAYLAERLRGRGYTAADKPRRGRPKKTEE